MEIKVSIVIPVYKVEKYIERCLRSVFNQTYVNIECIIVNDCTPDNSSAPPGTVSVSLPVPLFDVSIPLYSYL